MAAVLVAGCAAKTWMPVVATSVAITATACDYRETRGMASEWGSYSGPQKNWEENPVMGGDPSTSTVDSYFATVGSAEMVGGASIAALHGNARWVATAAMFMLGAYELELARENVNNGTPRCY